jgi:aspartyl protease family protein
MASSFRTASHLLVLALALAFAPQARSQNQSVAMTGGMGSKALLVINGGRPKALSAGDEHQGVKVVSVGKEQTVVEIGGKRQTVLLGGAPVSLGGGGSGAAGTQISLTATEGGHFRTQGSINGRSVDFMVDTGATVVSLGADEAKRIGLKYEDGEKVMTSTANGRAMGYLVRLRSVRIQDVEVFDVQAIVGAAPMPFVLLGNSFLTRFQMKRENDQLTLSKRY